MRVFILNWRVDAIFLSSALLHLFLFLFCISFRNFILVFDSTIVDFLCVLLLRTLQHQRKLSE